MATLTEMKKDDLKQPESITAKLERFACDYRNDLEVAIYNVDTDLAKNLTELVEEFGHKAVEAAVDASEDDDLRIDYGPYPSLYEALVYVLEHMPDEALQDS